MKLLFLNKDHNYIILYYMEQYFEKLDFLGKGTYGKVYKAVCLQDIENTLEIPNYEGQVTTDILNSINLTSCLGTNLEKYKYLCSVKANNSIFQDRIKLRFPIYQGQVVAIKQINSDNIKDINDYNDIIRELKITLLLNDPHIIKVYGGFLHVSDDDYKGFYIVMELFETSGCETIQNYINRGGNVKTPDLQSYVFSTNYQRTKENSLKERMIFYQIAKAVKTIHNKGIIHCDLKPENILVRDMYDKDGNVSDPFLKITDFGFSILKSTAKNLDYSSGTTVYWPLKTITFDKNKNGRIRQNPVFKNEFIRNNMRNTLDYTFTIDIYAMFMIFIKCHTGRFYTRNKLYNSSTLTTRPTYSFDFNNKVNEYVIPEELKNLLIQMCEVDKTKRININQVLEHPYFTDRNIKAQFNEAFEVHKTFLTRNIDRIWNRVGVSKNIKVLLPIFNGNINVLHKQVKNKYSNPINFSNKTLKRLIYSGIFGLGESKGIFTKTRDTLNIVVIEKNIKQLKHFIVSCPTFKLKKLFTETIKEGKYKDKKYYEMMLDGLLNGSNDVKKRAFEVLSIERLATIAFKHYKGKNINIKIFTDETGRDDSRVISNSDNFNTLISGNSPIAIIPVSELQGGKKPVKKIVSGKKPVKKIVSGKKPVKKIVSGKKRTIYTGIRGGRYYLKNKNGKKYKVYVTL